MRGVVRSGPLAPRWRAPNLDPWFERSRVFQNFVLNLCRPM